MTDEHRPADQTDTPEGMKRVRVMKNFTLLRKDGTLETFTVTGTNCGLPGVYDMPPEDADHFYTRLNSDQPPELPAPLSGTRASIVAATEAEHADALRDSKLTAARKAEADKARRAKQKDLADKLGPSFEQAP